VNPVTTDASSDAPSPTRAIPVKNTTVPNSGRLLPGGEVPAEEASPSTALQSDIFSRSLRSGASSFTSKYTESAVGPNKTRVEQSKTAGNAIASRSKAEMDHDLAGTESTCEQAKGPIPTKINLSQSSFMRVLSDDIDRVFEMVKQTEPSHAATTGGK